MTIRFEERIASLVSAAGIVWAAQTATRQWQGVDALLLPRGPLEICGIGILIWLTRGEGKIILVLAALVSLELYSVIAVGDTGVMQFPFLLLSWVLWKKQWQASAILMGIAISIKQVCWVYMLFYLILIFREMGLRRLLKTIFVTGGIFLALNLPFVMLNPAIWINSMLAVVTDPLFPMGVGFISLVSSGIVVIKNSLVFDSAAILVLSAGLVWYYFNCRRYPYFGPLLAILPFFFAWRSLWNRKENSTGPCHRFLTSWSSPVIP